MSPQEVGGSPGRVPKELLGSQNEVRRGAKQLPEALESLENDLIAQHIDVHETLQTLSKVTI